MSVEASAWAWKQTIPANPKYVLIALADWYNELESCAWPSNAKLCEKTGLSRRTVQRSIGWLTEHKLVVPETRFKNNRQVSNRYRLPIGTIHIQGCQAGTPRGVTVAQGGCHSDAPIKDTVKDTVKDTINSGKPQESSVKVEEVIGKMSKSRESIFDKFKPTAKGCGDFWRDARAHASDENGYAGELTQKQWKQLKDAHDKLTGIDFREVVWKVCSDWTKFVKHAEKHFGAFNMGLNPTVAKFYLYRDAAADYAQQSKPVTLTAKPLTNKPAPCKPIPKAKPKAEVAPYVNPYHPKPKKTAAEKAAIMAKHNKVDS